MLKNGFTLVELIIVVAIIGILTSIVYPSYSDYVRRANRSDAKIVLSELSQRQERFFTENLRYAGNFTALSNGAVTAGNGIAVYIEGSNGNLNAADSGQNYKLRLLGANGTAFTLNATANSVRQLKDDSCLWFSIASTGFQDAQTDNCWDR